MGKSFWLIHCTSALTIKEKIHLEIKTKLDSPCGHGCRQMPVITVNLSFLKCIRIKDTAINSQNNICQQLPNYSIRVSR